MEKELIHEVENKLVEIVGRSNVYVKASPIPEFDWMLCIRGYEFLCEVKKTVTRSNFGSIQMKLRTWQENTDKPVLLVVQNIYPLLMDEFAHQGINSLDSAGNCRIKVGDLLMHIEGRKVPPKFQATSANRSRLFQEAGILKLLKEFIIMNYNISSDEFDNLLIKELLEKLSRYFEKEKLPFYVIGATARDIIMQKLLQQRSARHTQDLDIAIAISDWQKFEEISNGITQIDGFEKSLSQK